MLDTKAGLVLGFADRGGPGVPLPRRIRAILERGRTTATVSAKMPVHAARIPAEVIDRTGLEKVAEDHRREESKPATGD